MRVGCNGMYTRAFRVAQIGNRRARALSRKPTLKQTNKHTSKSERERERGEMKGEQFSRNRKRLARAARDEKFSISRTIIVALAAFTADARFQSGAAGPLSAFCSQFQWRGRG